MNWTNKIKWLFQKKSFENLEDWMRVELTNEYSSRDLHKMSKTDYLNFYKWRCFVAVSTIANAVAWLQRQVTDWKWKPINDPMEYLISWDLLVNIVSYLKLNGECYVRKNKVWNKIEWLVVLRPDRIRPILNSTKTEIVAYDYTIENRHQRIEKEEMIVFMNFNPNSPYPLNISWMSDVQAVAMTIDADYQASKWNWKFFYNQARVDGVLETEQPLTTEAIEKITTRRNQKYRWTDNAHKIWVLTGGLKYRSIQASQKEMDFVESRRLNRDEILAIFKVPKAILWLGEWWNALNVRSFEQIFAKEVVLPLARMIQEKLNMELFEEWKWFEFVNVVPSDLEQTRQDRLANAMTLNEFRATRNLPPVKDGDKLRSAYIMGAYGAWSDDWNEEQQVVDLDKEIELPVMKNFELKKQVDWIIEKKIKEKIKGTEEYNQKYWEAKMQRNNKFNELYFEDLQKIFNKQEKEIMSEYKKRYDEQSKKWFEKKEMSFPLLSLTKRAIIYNEILKNDQQDLVKMEAENALIEVWLVDTFDIDDVLKVKLRKNIERFAWSIDKDTNKKLEDNFQTILSEWLSFSEWRDLLKSTFEELKTTRADLIVRTETVRAWNMWSQIWREKSGVVAKKQRYTALDERVCEYCWPMNWRIIWLEDNFFNQGDVLIGERGGSMNLDYSETPYPPLHPNCRCVIVPVIE